jgi:lipid-A-disaccharide synthase
LLELWRNLPEIVSTWRKMNRALASANPDLVVLIDSGGFNIPFARRVRRRCGAKILYFVAPQVWAWRPGRIRKLARRVDRMALIFPFEPDVYAKAQLRVEFVGHPLVEPLGELAREVDCDTARARLGCAARGDLISLFPGSRGNEIRYHLPLLLSAIALLYAQFPKMRFLLAMAPTVSRSEIDRLIAAAELPVGLKLDVFEGRVREVMLASDVALATPGTVTVELALLARPMVVVGRVNPITALVLRRAVRVPYYAMPNLVVGREIVPEFLQEKARPEAIAHAVAQLVEGPSRERQLKDLAEVRGALSSTSSTGSTSSPTSPTSPTSPSAVQRASEIAGEMLELAAE